MSKISSKVSVLMGIYNCEKTLGRAIESVLNQSYVNWELIMCDDGSNDSTYEIAKIYEEKYPDKIILLKNHENKGLNITLNKCLAMAKGEYIARQDADDCSLPKRFTKQVEYLNNNRECAFVSTSMVVNNGIESIGKRIQPDTRPQKKGFMYSNQFFHAPVMIRKSALLKVNGYTEDVKLLRVEDYNLWTKLYAAGFYGENMKEILYEVYEDEMVYKRRRLKYRINGAYALILAVDMLGLPQYYKAYAIKGIIKGVVPNYIYKRIHQYKLKKDELK